MSIEEDEADAETREEIIEEMDALEAAAADSVAGFEELLEQNRRILDLIESRDADVPADKVDELRDSIRLLEEALEHAQDQQDIVEQWQERFEDED